MCIGDGEVLVLGISRRDIDDDGCERAECCTSYDRFIGILRRINCICSVCYYMHHVVICHG
jgi:hypothetical protein